MQHIVFKFFYSYIFIFGVFIFYACPSDNTFKPDTGALLKKWDDCPPKNGGVCNSEIYRAWFDVYVDTREKQDCLLNIDCNAIRGPSSDEIFWGIHIRQCIPSSYIGIFFDETMDQETKEENYEGCMKSEKKCKPEKDNCEAAYQCAKISATEIKACVKSK